MTVETFKDAGGRVSFSREGWAVERTFIISGLSGSADRLLYNAISHASIPAYGQPHPAIPGIAVTSIDAEPLDVSGSQVRVRVQYSVPTQSDSEESEVALDKVVISVGSTTQSGTTQKDKDGKQLIATLTQDDGTEAEQAGEVTIEIPQTVIHFERREPSDPIAKSIEFVGTVNDARIGALFPERTLLCTEIEGTTEGIGLPYQVSYSFQYNRDTWDATYVFVDTETDKPHEDASTETGNGVVTSRVYPEANFSKLSLPFP